MKTCSKCGSVGPFYNVRGTLCVECHRARGRAYYAANREAVKAKHRALYATSPARRASMNARSRAHYQKNADRVKGQMRASRLRIDYGLTPEAFDQMFENQEGLCGVCSCLMVARAANGLDGNRVACVDHDHHTGKVRGLLCRACNSGIGRLKDSITLLRNAVGYLEDAARAA